MSNHSQRNNHKPALSFRVWDTGDETSMTHPGRLIQAIEAHQKMLANELGETVPWRTACVGFLNEVRTHFEAAIREVEPDLQNHPGEEALPDA